MVHCRKCNRPLTNPVSIAKGIGRICEMKSGTWKSIKQGHDDGDVLLSYDGGNFWIERMDADTVTEFPGVTGTFTTPQKHTASGCRSNVPRQIYRHSPTGYNFGYGGSGPADFALNICLLLVHADDAYQHYQTFKSRFVAGEQSDRLEIKRTDAEKFFTDLGVQLIDTH